MLLLQNLNISVAYTPPDNIALDCGSTNNNTDITGRLWLGDTKYLDQPNNIESVVLSVSDNDTGFLFVNELTFTRIEKNMALEMLYRTNVGGKFLSPSEDTGMCRSWSTDDDYLTDARPSALPFNTIIKLNFSKIRYYMAPVPIYVCGRSMGNDKTMNGNYRLTWQFQVDPGFTYLVRLHFCEFQSEITAVGDRVLQIYIHDLVAENEADVVSWAGGSRIPVYRDYAVMIAEAGNQKKTNLSIALHPGPVQDTLYSDAILNGLEIFKLSNDGNLTGSNPDPDLNLQMSPPSGASPSQLVKPKNDKATIITAVGGVVAGLFTISLLCFMISRFGSVHCNSWCALSFCSKTEPTSTYGPVLPSNMCRHFSLGEIKTATNNFENTSVIGAGGFGNVYKAFIDGGSKAVAIKRLNPGSQKGAHEFRTEIEMLSQLRHHNLVSLIGYCEDNNEMILVYDYMVHGALRDHLYKTNKPPLDWEQRLRICIGAAHGLHYLHRGPNHTIIHRDVILLGEKWVAKVSDFGLSKMNNLSKTHISTVVKGGFGYLDPEYYRLLRLTEKSDVYSFGVVLCEVLCARAPLDPTVDHMQISLVEWAQHCYNNGTLDQIIDPYLQGKINPASLKKFDEVAINCLASEGIKRPVMSEVVCGLELALQLQESEMNAKAENHLNDSTVIDYHVLFTSGSGSMNTGG
ncbi:PREDICTED: receptor-like protein kinase FERONIA [Theobroma cacao]|uniref:Receptor-like protein kinase FERONIA n=1 Tax=Theobroma cacao TaxID=3641 RepID=A0AB32WAH4_THECC|nr:PREDICTED: receptor-like protein kinase FERONIA [Theobroma cacao]